MVFSGKAFNESFTDTQAADPTKPITTSKLSLDTKMSACTEHLLSWQKSARCLSISEQAEGRMRFPESLIQLKASGAFKGAFSLPCFYLLFPLAEHKKEFISQQKKKWFSISGARKLPGRSSAFCWFRILFFRHMNTGSKHKSVRAD